MIIEKYTFGMGDRFAHQGKAQLQAILQAKADGIDVYPVWNKSNREHRIVNSQPQEVREEADTATAAMAWDTPYYVDADHIGLSTVEPFLACSDFFTIDVAEAVGTAPSPDQMEAFLGRNRAYLGMLHIPGINEPFEVTEATLRTSAETFLAAIAEAARVYKRIAEIKGEGTFVTEISVDETETVQKPVEFLLILSMIAAEGIPVQTIAPKFTGRFNKGVDYVGDLQQFEREFDEDLHVIAFAVETFGLPPSLKLSVHSGSDKFSLYPVINRLIRAHDAGLHVKTAGTTWLEELIGLAEAGGEALALAKEIYQGAYERFEELTGPYATVIDINRGALPSPDDVADWGARLFADSLRHDPSHPVFNPHLRQLLHVGFKVAAEMGTRFTDALDQYEDLIAEQVTTNLYQRHLLPIFSGLN